MQLLPSEINIEFLRTAFPEVRFILLQSNDTERFISCFVSQFNDIESCSAYWKKITNHIALDFQEGLSNRFASWNIYLALITPSPLDKHLKYKIENDRFALRKIVISGASFVSDLNSAVISALEDSILGKDLQLTSGKITAPKDDSGSIIFSYLSKLPPLPLDGKEKSAQVRKNRINELLEQFSQS